MSDQVVTDIVKEKSVEAVTSAQKTTNSVENPPQSLQTGLNQFHKKQVEAAIRLLIQGLGLDLSDPNLIDTPKRVVRAYREFCLGVYDSSKQLEGILGRTFPCDHSEMLCVGPIHSVGLCPHHLLPVSTTGYLAYIPNGRVVGLSKIPRMMKLLSARPVLQETLTTEIANAFMDHVHPQGVAVFLRSQHGCMTSRGILETESSATTVAVRGSFLSEPHLEDKFYKMIEMKVK